MRILHTSDLHLSENKPETLDALNEILRVAKKNSVELVTIAGDIFDSQKDAEALRGHIRPIFDDLSFEVLAIPGNHDGSIFSRGYDFGFRVVTAKPHEEIAIGDLTFIAVPYSDESPDEILLSLMSAASTAKTRILLLHCTLDIGFDASGFGEESSLKYFPVSKIALAELNYDYILAGHFHSKCEVISLSEKSKFIYPGSPTSHSWKETGCRHGVLIDTEKRRTSKVPLSTRYYDRLALKVTPGKEKQALDELKIWHDGHVPENSELEVIVRGIIEQDEAMFTKALEKIAQNARVKREFKDIRTVLQHPLYQRFHKKLKSQVEESKIDRVNEVVLEVMSTLIAGGDFED